MCAESTTTFLWTWDLYSQCLILDGQVCSIRRFLVARGASDGKDSTYEVAVIVKGANHVVRVGVMENMSGVYVSEGGFDEAFPYARGAVRAIGSWANRVPKGETVQFPVQLVI